MGTSSRHPGSNDRSPLVPPHADAEPGKPLPDPPKKRFQQFRRNLGSYVKSGDKKDLNKGLKHYVHSATGGAGVGPRRFGTAIATGGVLISALAALGSGVPSPDAASDAVDENQEAEVNVSDAIGKPLSDAIAILADSLAPSGEDSDKIREALVCALSESLQGLDENFNPEALDEEIYAQTIIHFLAEIVFLDIQIESGEAFEKAESSEVLEEREDEIREVIRTAIDKHLSTYVEDTISSLSLEDIKNIQLSALKDVFAEWDGLE